MVRSVQLLILLSLILALPFAVHALRQRLTGTRPTRSYLPHLVFLCAVSLGPRLSSGNAWSSAEVWRTFVLTLGIWIVGVVLGEMFNRQSPLRSS